MMIFGYFLWQEVGVATLAGIGFVVFLIPIECKPNMKLVALN